MFWSLPNEQLQRSDRKPFTCQAQHLGTDRVSLCSGTGFETHLTFAAVKESASPSTNGTSGPIATKPMSCSWQNCSTCKCDMAR